jgi:Fe-S cluster assembly protein SufD
MINIDLKPANTKDSFLILFDRNKERLYSGSPGFINNIREEAIKKFGEIGLPVKKTENYKYTNIDDQFNRELHHNLVPGPVNFEIEDIFQCDIPELDTRVILVLNGFHTGPGEPLTKLENGIIYGSLRAASHEYPELFRKHYARYSDFSKDGITALNTAFAQDGVFLYVPKNSTVDKPFQIIHLLLSDEPQMVQHRNLFILEDNARAKVLVCDHTLSTAEFLTNSVTEIYAGPGANISFIRVQNEHNKSTQVTNAYVHQMRDSNVTTNYVTLHGGLIRNNVYVNLADEGATNQSIGLFLVDKNQHVDNFVCVNHKKPNCTSSQLYKGILDDEASGAFNGKIHVWQDAQHTQAYQKNNNILLTDTAKMHTKPQLEIYADDVKCSHGATVGQLDQDALFYLRSRGISQKESLHLLMYAFTDEVLKEIKLPALRERITELVDKRLRGELSKCNNCKMKCR